MTPDTVRRRDVQRSRTAILAAAEAAFARRGYAATSLAEIAARAGVSRALPSYLFGAKETLYVAVLDQVFAARQQATLAAFAPVLAWAEDPDGGGEELRDALTVAAEAYLSFLAERPTFTALVLREGLAGGATLDARRATSTAMHDAFSAVRAVAGHRGLARFDVEEAIVLFVGLTFGPMSLADTLMRTVGRDLADPAVRHRQAQLAADQVMHLLRHDGGVTGAKP